MVHFVGARRESGFWMGGGGLLMTTRIKRTEGLGLGTGGVVAGSSGSKCGHDVDLIILWDSLVLIMRFTVALGKDICGIDFY